MSISGFVTAVPGVLAFVGVVGMVWGASSTESERRNRIFRFGSFAMTAAGLFVMLASLMRSADSDGMFGGFLMMVFGSGASLAPLKKAPPPTSDECLG